MRRATWIGGLVAVVLLAWVVASPWLTVYQMKRAADRHDAEALSVHVDYDSLRQGLKRQVSTGIDRAVADDDGNPTAQLSTMVMGAVVDVMVETFVTPEGLAEMMRHADSDAESGKSPSRGPADHSSRTSTRDRATMAYTSFNRFAVDVRDRHGAEARFILHRQGPVTWKLADILIPVE